MISKEEMKGLRNGHMLEGELQAYDHFPPKDNIEKMIVRKYKEDFDFIQKFIDKFENFNLRDLSKEDFDILYSQINEEYARRFMDSIGGEER